MTKSRGIRPHRPRWLSAEIELLTRLYPDSPTSDIAKQLDTTIERIYSKASALGLKKSEAYLASPAACRLRRGDNVGAAFRFKPGQNTWNKGTNFTAGGRSAETRFKPGNRSGRAVEIYQPIGAERVSKDGYLQRKINDNMPLQKRWRGAHILVWEEANGPLPPGHAIIFKDGDKTNIALGNLELVTRAELMRRNSYHTNYPKEIAELIQLRGALNRKINSRSKKNGQDNRRSA